MQATVPSELLLGFLLAVVRAGAWLVVSPPFSSRAVPARVKALLAAALALSAAPRLGAVDPDLSTGALVALAAQQAAMGAALGFLTALVFAAVQAAGDILDLFGGFSLAYAFDPLNNVGNSVFGKLYGLLATTLLFVSGGHLLVLRGFLTSYEALPLDAGIPLGEYDRLLTDALATMFVAALQIAGPLVAVLFLADVGLGLLTRVAPALNAFSLDFPAKILLTLVLTGLGFPLLPSVVEGLTTDAVEAVMTVLRR